MCGGPVKKATGGVMKSAAPKGASNALTMAPKGGAPKVAKTTGAAASLSSALGTLSAASKTSKSAASTRQVQPTPPKGDKTMGGEPRRSNEGISAKQLLAGTAGDYAAPPEKAKTTGGAPKTTSSPQWKQSDEDAVTRYAKATSVEDGKKFRVALGQAKQAKTGTPPEPIREAPRPTMEPKRQVQPTPPKGVKVMGSVGMAKKGVPVASNKPMIGFKTGGHVTKSMTKW